MAPQEDEEELLRSVALQNARSILLARQRAEEALQKQSEWLRITLSSIGDGVICTDAEGRVTFLNGVAEALTGWSRAEAMGRPLSEVFHIVNERTREPVENPALRALREGRIVGLANHTVLIARDGTERPIDDSAAPIRGESGALLGAVLVFRDVTERKRAEEARARLAAIVESSDDAIVSQDTRRRHPVVERRGRAPLRVLTPGSRRSTHHPDHPAGAARRGTRDPGATLPRGADRAFRDGPRVQGWPPPRDLPDGLPHLR